MGQYAAASAENRNLSRRRLLLLALAFVAVLLCSVALPAQAHATNVINKKLVSVSFDYDDTSTVTKTFTSYDITGDAKADTMKFVIGNGKVKVYVGGSLRGTVTYSGAYDYSVKYIRTTTKHPFLYITATGDNLDGKYVLYQYKNGKLNVITSQAYIPSSYATHRYIDNVWAYGKTVKVRYGAMTYTAGTITATYTFKWSSSTLKRTSTTASVVSIGGTSNSSSRKFTLRKAMTLYKTAGGSTKVVTASKGSKVKINSICVKNSKLYFKVTTTAGKTGWFKGLTSEYYADDGYGYNSLFKECLLAG